jgi:hypothetical protein
VWNFTHQGSVIAENKNAQNNRVVARKKKTGFLTLVPTLDKSKTKLVFGGCELGSCFGGRCFTLVCFVWLDKMNTHQ